MGVDCLWSMHLAIAVTSALLGETDNFHESFALSRERCGNDPELNAFNDAMGSIVANVFGRFDQALALAHRGIDGAETKGTAYCRCMTRQALSLSLFNHGEFHRAAEFAGEALSIMEEQNTGRAHLGGVAGVLSLAELALGDAGAARSRSSETIVFCHERTQYWELSAWVASARSCIAQGDQEAALAAMVEMEQLVERTGAVVQRPNLHINRALFARGFSSEWDADVEWALAREAYVALGAHSHIARLERFDDRSIFV